MTVASDEAERSSVGSRPRFGVRLGALLIDYLLISAWMGVLGLGALVVFRVTGSLPDWLASGGALGAEVLGFALLVLPVGIYLYATEASSRQATIGKRVLRLRVVDARTARRARRPQILVRTIVKLLPWEVAHFFIWQLVAVNRSGQASVPRWIGLGFVAVYLLPIVYLLMVAFGTDARGPHDLAAGTMARRDAESAGEA